ncbi:hypothetical protein B0T11DRAFT_127968 [Plectosphaerella cucumerina]|uniref:Secreted protein n=1 Tax=Plectosphaerella cucumerina TaxID=40658 RepID=A0A8K0X0D5_9PEZI|nr:hypothetical protein B0T11DRAFT_127968 [Plectosphaerella cucumerina]
MPGGNSRRRLAAGRAGAVVCRVLWGLMWSVRGEKCRHAAEEVHMQPDAAGKCCPMARLPLLPLLSPVAAAISVR